MLVNLVIDILIYVCSFYLILFIKTGNISFINSYSHLIIVIVGSLVFSSLAVGKYNKIKSSRIIDTAKPYFNSFILTVGLLTIYFNLFQNSRPSRLIIVGTIVLGLILELVNLTFSKKEKFKTSFSLNIRISPLIFLFELLLLTWLVLFTYLIYIDSFAQLTTELPGVAMLYFLWFMNGMLTDEFVPIPYKKNYWRFIWSHFKGFVILIALNSFANYLLLPEGLSSEYPILISIIFSAGVLIVNSVLFIYLKSPKTDEVKTKFLKATELFERPIIANIESRKRKYCLGENENNANLNELLLNVYLKKFPDVYNFLTDSVDLYSFDSMRSVIIKSADPYNVEVLPENYLELYMNLHEMNDMRYLNRYFIEINSTLIYNGLFIGKIEPLSLRRKRFIEHYPYYIGIVIYFFDFIWKRIFPKIPFIKRFYFSLTRGKSRVISLSETIGRLFYCGFEIVNIRQLGNFFYFIAKKVNEPLSDRNPSYGPFIKLKRVGQEGKLINVYKFRTMYPYSEYLQKFIYDFNQLECGGKIKNDFRITSYGRLIRKVWIDELPMIINWLKRELKLVGVRPLSQHYISLYPLELRNRRIKHRPGLIPPFYYDLPITFEEIILSEKKYLDQYEKHPVLTDTKYFFICLYNIVVKKARSA